METIDRPLGSLGNFTAKQCEVLDLLLAHKSSKEIARTLNISPYTVDQRITAARQRLGVVSRGELARSYSAMKGLCEKPAYDFSQLATHSFSPHDLPRDQLADPVFMLSDAAFVQRDVPWHGDPVLPVGLEAFDDRFGIFGRIIVIPALAVSMALLVLAMLAIAETLSKLL